MCQIRIGNAQLLQVVSAHGVKTMMLRTINVVLVTENADAHARAWDIWQLDGTRETLVTLWVVVLEANLQLDRLEEVSLLGVGGVVEQLLHVLSNAGDRDLRHDGRSS